MGKLLDSIIEGRAKYNDVPQTLRRIIESSGFKKPWLYDAFGVPVITNLVERSVDSGNSDVYSLGDINDILKVRDGNKPDLLVHAENKPDVSIPPSEDPNWPYPGNYPRNDSNTDVPFKPSSKAEPTVNDLPKTNVTGRAQSIYRRIIDFMRKNKNPLIFAGAGAVGGAAIATAIALAISKNRKKKKALRKQAGFRDSITGYLARKLVPEIDLADKGLTARTKDDYREFNDNARDLLTRRTGQLADVSLNNGTVGNLMATFTEPFYLPGGSTYPESDTWSSFAKGTVSGQGQGRPAGAERIHGIVPDARLVPLTMLASTMLPSTYLKRYSDDPSIGNMAYVAPFVTGQYVIDKGMSEEDMAKAKTNGLDKVVIDSINHNVSRYPALRNAISMYINGGAGDVSDAKGFGIQRSFWDYAAKAPTIEGTNMLRKVVGDIALSGGYGGKEPKRIRDKDGNLTDNFVDPYTGYSKDKQNRHYSELLRFFDSVGPHIFSPRTVLGNQMLTHPEGGILSNIEKGWLRALPYFEKDPDLVNKANMAFGGGVIGDTVNKLSDKADKAAK